MQKKEIKHNNNDRRTTWGGAKRSKTAAAVSDVKNRLDSALKAICD